MEFLSAHKLKIAASAVTVISGVIGLGIGIPKMMSAPDNLQEKQIKAPQRLNQQVKNPQQAKPKADPKPEIRLTDQVMNLKNSKTHLQNDVSNQITIYKNMIQGAQKIDELDQIFQECESKGEVNPEVSEDEKKSLKDNYKTVKSDLQKYEEINNKVTTDLKDKESRSDKDKENEDNYKAFKEAFDKVKKEYDDVSDKKSDEKLYNSFKVVYDKLKTRNSQCTFKDVIKINDRYGQLHQNS